MEIQVIIIDVSQVRLKRSLTDEKVLLFVLFPYEYQLRIGSFEILEPQNIIKEAGRRAGVTRSFGVFEGKRRFPREPSTYLMIPCTSILWGIMPWLSCSTVISVKDTSSVSLRCYLNGSSACLGGLPFARSG
jgi:hypothetical protein